MKAAFIAGLLFSQILITFSWAQEHIAHGRFQDVALYKPAGEVKQFVLLLSGDNGWDEAADRMARILVGQNAMVAGISTPQFLQDFENDAGACVFPDGDLENLSHYVQGYARLPLYFTPVLVGYSSGAALAYAILAQAPAGIFAGAISLDFHPVIRSSKLLCSGDSLRFYPRRNNEGMVLLPAKKLLSPWFVLLAAKDQTGNNTAVRHLVASVPKSELIIVPKAGSGFSQVEDWMPEFVSTFNFLTAKIPAAKSTASQSLEGLPVVEMPAAGNGDTFAVLLSGDGGWAGIDKDVAAALAEKGIPVVGLDTLRYFWSARTPDGLASDMDLILRHYAGRWNKTKVLLIGYSQGANVLPFAINRLPPGTRKMVAHTVLMGLGHQASFEFHLGNWFRNETSGLPILPEVLSLDAQTTLCIFGEDEDAPLCPEIPPRHVQAQILPGGHHFDGDYDKLAELILARSGINRPK